MDRGHTSSWSSAVAGRSVRHPSTVSAGFDPAARRSAAGAGEEAWGRSAAGPAGRWGHRRRRRSRSCGGEALALGEEAESHRLLDPAAGEDGAERRQAGNVPRRRPERPTSGRPRCRSVPSPRPHPRRRGLGRALRFELRLAARRRPGCSSARSPGAALATHPSTRRPAGSDAVGTVAASAPPRPGPARSAGGKSDPARPRSREPDGRAGIGTPAVTDGA
jgi:hypothetical protein